MKTWDGKHAIDQIELRVVYFVPRDRTPLPDWRERVAYYCQRIEQFHTREFHGQSKLTTQVEREPFRSERTTAQLRAGDADFIFFRTLEEVDTRLKPVQAERQGFPILLVLSDINWRPLDDFFRVKPNGERWEFEGQFIDGRHHPGAASGGARATYLADRGTGWGLVSADGWRVPYCGSDCVVYHEGVGHTIGLPHPEPGNGSVMSLAQYRFWISESWLDDDQKKRLGWTAPEKPIEKPRDKPFDRATDLFSTFKALPEPLVPKPDQEVLLKLNWPAGTHVRSCRVRIQTELAGPWLEVARVTNVAAPASLKLGRFDRPTPVSYRIDAETNDQRTAELWGYFQVRSEPGANPLPAQYTGEHSAPLFGSPSASIRDTQDEVDLLALVDVERHRVSGQWTRRNGALEAPKEYGARIEIPYQPPAEYRLTVIAEPLDEPNGLILGQRSGESRFLALVNFDRNDKQKPRSALENIDGLNVDRNATTINAALLKKNRPSQIVCTVRKTSVTVTVDGQEIIHWQGEASRLGLSDYWNTPTPTALFLGAYDCRYRFTRVTLSPISGTGKKLPRELK